MNNKPNERPDMFKTSVNPNDLPSNYIYGVDTNNRQAVEKAYKKLKRRHILITILSIILLGGLIFLIYDFSLVNFMNKKPYLGIKEKIDGGYIYKGIGYNAMFCDNGKVYKTYLENKTCSDEEVDKSFKGIVLREFKEYLIKNKYLDTGNLKSLEIVSLTYDEDNNNEGGDYLAEVKLECNDGSARCMKVFKETSNQNEVQLFIRLDRNNEVYEVTAFKTTGNQYKLLKDDYEEKIKKYMIDNNLIDEENLRLFTVQLLNNYGRYRFDDVMYEDSYTISIEYLCHDNSNTCVSRFDNSLEFSNLSFEASMFINESNEVGNMRSSQVLQ